MNNDFLYKIILIITCVFIVFLVYEIVDNIEKEREAFDVKKEAKKIGDSILKPITSEINNSVSTIGNGITKITGKVGEGLKKVSVIGKAITNVAKQVGEFFGKIGKAFQKIGVIIYNGIIKPLLGFFLAIGNVFVQLLSILMKIIDKIIQLPNCMPVFMVGGAIDGANSFYKAIVPSWIRDILSLVYRFMIEFPLWVMYYTIALPLDIVTNLILKFSIINYISGFFKTKCYGFDVDKQVKSMGNGFTNAANDFKKNFGKLNFADVF